GDGAQRARELLAQRLDARGDVGPGRLALAQRLQDLERAGVLVGLLEQLGQLDLEGGRGLAGCEQLETALELAGGEVVVALLLEGEGQQLARAAEVGILR